MKRIIALIVLSLIPCCQIMAAEPSTKPVRTPSQLMELKTEFLKERVEGYADVIKMSERESKKVGSMLKNVEKFSNLSEDEILSIIFNRDRLEKSERLRGIAQRLIAVTASKPDDKDSALTLESVISQLQLETMKQIEFQSWYLQRGIAELSEPFKQAGE